MARRKSIGFERIIGGDERFGSEAIQKLINVIMERGKKTVASRIVYEALEVLIKKSNGDAQKGLQLYHDAINQLIPIIEVRPRRVGGSVYQIPMEVRPRRAQSLALRWLIGGAEARPNKTMGQRLAAELLDALEGRGGAFKKRSDVHKMAESNRAFSHYAW